MLSKKPLAHSLGINPNWITFFCLSGKFSIKDRADYTFKKIPVILISSVLKERVWKSNMYVLEGSENLSWAASGVNISAIHLRRLKGLC
jgi:hypothetical protein